MSFTPVTVTAAYVRGPEQTPASGEVEFQYDHVMQDQAGNVIATTTPLVVTLDASGSLSVVLPATDDPTTVPTGVALSITERIEDANERRYRVTLPSATSPTDLADLSPAIIANPLYNYALVGHTHPGGGGDLTYVHTQTLPATVWPIPHNLGKFPAITVVDSSKRVVISQIDHIDVNNATSTQSGAFAGWAYCN